MANIATKKFTSSGSWTAPAGVTQATIRMWGGGAGGSFAEYNEEFFPAGGGNSEAVITTVDVVPNTSYTVTIGAGGTAGTFSVAAGDGGDTTFGSLATGLGVQSYDNVSDAVSLFDSPTLSPYPFAVGGNCTAMSTSGSVTATNISCPLGKGADGTSTEFFAQGGSGGFSGPGGAGGAGGDILTGFAFIEQTSVTIGTDQFNWGDTHGFVTQDAVFVTVGESPGVLPSPLVSGTTYYAIRIDDLNFQLATTFANAGTGTQIDITDTGTDPTAGSHPFLELITTADGTAAAANTGAGGGAAGLNGDGSETAAAGGSGFLEVTWSE